MKTALAVLALMVALLVCFASAETPATQGKHAGHTEHDHSHEGHDEHNAASEHTHDHDHNHEDHDDADFHSHDDEKPVCVLGTGKVGAKVVELLARARIVVEAWNRDNTKAVKLVQELLNVASHSTARAAISECHVIVTALPSAEIDLQVLRTANLTELHGKHWIQLSGNGKGNQASCAAFAAEHKLEYVPAEISCSVEDLGQEFCDVLLGRAGVSPDEMAVHLFNYLHVASALGSPAVVHDKDEL